MTTKFINRNDMKMKNKEMFKRIQELENQNKLLVEEVARLSVQESHHTSKVIQLLNKEKKILESLEEVKKKNEFIKSVGKNITVKLISAISLYESINNYFKKAGYKHDLDGGIAGSFNRQFFEFPFAIVDDFSDQSYGNPKNHDVDIIIVKNKSDSVTSIHKSYYKETELILRQMCNEINTYLKFHLLNPQKVTAPIFGELKLIEILDITLTKDKISSSDPCGKKKLVDIPHFLFKLIDSNNSVYTFDIMGWTPSVGNSDWPNGDFDSNSIILSKFGFNFIDRNIESKTNFYDTLFRIRQKETCCLINLCDIQNKAFQGGLTRNDKVIHLKQLAFFFANRLKIMAYGYNSISSDSSIPCFSIERKEDCFITSCKPPYINIHLNCNHKISLMAYIGELVSGNRENSEAIRCPLCRGDLKIKFEEKKVSRIPISSFDINIKEEKINYNEEENIFKKNILSDDSSSYIFELFSNQSSLQKDFDESSILPNPPNLPNSQQIEGNHEVLVPFVQQLPSISPSNNDLDERIENDPVNIMRNLSNINRSSRHVGLIDLS